MNVSDIIKQKPHLAWYVKNPTDLSPESVLEHVLIYGDWKDVQLFIKIAGIDETAKIFRKTLKKTRSNYPPAIMSYFSRYFSHYAYRNS